MLVLFQTSNIKNMNLQKLDKQQPLRRIDLRNEYQAHLWRKNKSELKYLESLSNSINESANRFILIWNNLDFFLDVKEKYDDIDDARDFITHYLDGINVDEEQIDTNELTNYTEIEEIFDIATKGDEYATEKAMMCYLTYAGGYCLLLETVAKSLTGYTFDAAFKEITNDIFPEDLTELSDAHQLCTDYFAFEEDEEYSFNSHYTNTINEYILGYDLVAISEIVSNITDADIQMYGLQSPNRDGKIFEELEKPFAEPSVLHEFTEQPYIEYQTIKLEVDALDLSKELFVCSIFLDLDEGKVKTITNLTSLSAEDVALCLHNLLSKKIYIHPITDYGVGDQIEISWVEAV